MGRSSICLALLALAACGGGDPISPPAPPPPPPAPAPVASVAVAPPSATLVPQQTTQLTATPKDASGNPLSGRTIAWTTNSSTVATVSAGGLVTAAAVGNATITATSEGKSGTVSITVRDGGFLAATGGTVTAASGNVTIVAPAGALSSGTALTVDATTSPPADPKLVAGTAYDFGPNGTTFTTPVTLRVKWATTPAGSDPSLFRLHLRNGNAWEPVAGSTVDVATKTVSASVSHFSSYAILETSPSLPAAAIAPGTIAVGYEHACGISQTSDAYCWGENGSGELGDGTLIDRATPTKVSTTQHFKMLAAGSGHTCGLTTVGQVLCWGDNSHGELGSGSTPATRSLPNPVTAGGLSFTWLAGSGDTYCAVTTTHLLYCWGITLGVTFDYEVQPTLIQGGASWTAISVGTYAACGLDDQGRAWCFGKSLYVNSGLGTGSALHTDARLVQTALRFSSVVTGNSNACGLQSGGALYCWGYNGLGALGDGGSTEHTTPARSGGNLSWVSVTAGDGEMCGAATDARLYCWGTGPANQYGTSGGLLANLSPTAVNGTPTLYALSLGGTTVCGVTSSGAAYCWGSNHDGGLGRGYLNYISTPTQVQLGTQVSDVQVKTWPCALSTLGQLYCWGSASALGLNSLIPVAMGGTLRFRSFGVGSGHLCGINLTAAQDSWCWGGNTYGELGDGTKTGSSTPRAVNGTLKFEQLDLGSGFTCGRTAAGPLYCWGYNGATTPQAVMPAVQFQSVQSSGNTGCGASTGNVLYCWGPSGGSVAQVAGAPQSKWGGEFWDTEGFNPQLRCALSTTGQAWCAGRNTYGQIGDGTHTNRATMVQVSGGHTFTQLAISTDHVCGVETNGDAYCWGSNVTGQLGVAAPVSNSDDRSVPTLVAGGLKFQRISTSNETGVYYGFDSMTCGVTLTGAVYCWGENMSGALGIGRETASTPGPVTGGVTFRNTAP